MSLKNETELANTRAKLARLEARYEAHRSNTESNQRLRKFSMTSLKRLINQFREEIARYETGSKNGGGRNRMLQNERELANTRDKFRILEERYEKARQETGGEQKQREAVLTSLKRFINQLTEEIARYEAHQPARR
ncbi:MAG: hypothetical protein WD468_06910 [Pirellulales bacterium]